MFPEWRGYSVGCIATLSAIAFAAHPDSMHTVSLWLFWLANVAQILAGDLHPFPSIRFGVNIVPELFLDLIRAFSSHLATVLGTPLLSDDSAEALDALTVQ